MRAPATALAAVAVVMAAGCGGGSGGKTTTTAPARVRVDRNGDRLAGRVDGFPHRHAGFVEEVFEIAVDKGSAWMLRERSLVRVSRSGLVGSTRMPGVANIGELAIAVGALLVGTESRPGRVYRVNPRTGKLLGTHPRPIVFENAVNGVAYLDGSVWVATNDGDPGTPDEIIRTTR